VLLAEGRKSKPFALRVVVDSNERGMMKKIIAYSVILLFIIAIGAVHAAVVTFDNNPLTNNSNWGGAGSGEIGFTSGDAYFSHTDSGSSWSGFVYSNRTDTTTAGYTNQFSAITGGGAQGSANYGIGYVPIDWQSGTYDPIAQTMSFGAVTGEDYNTTISGAYFSNTTYAYLSMRDGDSFAKKFGGDSGNDPDYFKLMISGIDESGNYTGTVDFYLADFRFDDNSQDYIVGDWTWVDLSVLGDVAGLEFSLESSDTGEYGINTPAYFAMDTMNPVPVPAAVWMMGSGLLALCGLRRKVR
jgi:hypothetical protein